jgi:hypothetical protein
MGGLANFSISLGHCFRMQSMNWCNVFGFDRGVEQRMWRSFDLECSLSSEEFHMFELAIPKRNFL